MPGQNRLLHNVFGVYAGPSPATGYHYSNHNNEKHNNPELTLFDNNLLKQIDRVNHVGFNINIDRENLTQLGSRGLIKRHIINRPEVEISLSYWIAGVRNENNLGLVVNYNDITGYPIYNQDICCFTNLTGQSTDYKNLFVAISPDERDIYNNISDINNNSNIDPSQLSVWSFGNCYLTSYSMSAGVGRIPEVSLNYIGDNVLIHSSGSGVNIPAVLSKSGNIVSGARFTIPRSKSISSPSVITPGNIAVDIQQYSGVESLNYLYLYNISTSTYNKIQISGEAGNENILIYSGISSPSDYYYSGIYIQNLTDSSYNRILVSGSTNNERLLIYSGISNPVTGGIFRALYLNNIINNQILKFNTTGYFNTENVIISDQIENIIYEPTNPVFGVNILTTPIQTVNLQIPLPRNSLRTVGHVLPVDRRIKFPIIAELDLSCLMNGVQSGNLVEKINKNEDYIISINMYNPSCSGLTYREIGTQYKLTNAQLQNINYSVDINRNTIANFKFAAEIDVGRLDKGLFISGLLNDGESLEYPYVYLRLENNGTGFLFTEDNIPLIIANTPE